MSATVRHGPKYNGNMDMPRFYAKKFQHINKNLLRPIYNGTLNAQIFENINIFGENKFYVIFLTKKVKIT